MRPLVAALTLLCFTSVTLSAPAAPFDEGVAAARAALPALRDNISAARAQQVAPGYNQAPPESAYRGQPNLPAAANADLAACVGVGNDLVCEAKLSARQSAQTPRAALTTADPLVSNARDVVRSPSTQLGDLSAFYSGCAVSTQNTGATSETRLCHRYLGIGNYACRRTLDVGVSRTPNCTPGDWFAHADSGAYGLDAQCLPDRPASSQHLRVTVAGNARRYFDFDMGRRLTFPQAIAAVGGRGQDTQWLWLADNRCTGNDCSVTGLVAPEQFTTCSGTGKPGERECTRAPTFLPLYAPCPDGQQRGGNIQQRSGEPDSGYLVTTLDDARCYVPAVNGEYAGRDVSGTLRGNRWDFSAQRDVVGWRINPAFTGQLPRMALAYTLPAMLANQQDSWNDGCPADVAGRCTLLSADRCIDGPATHRIDGLDITRACWQYERRYTCADGAPLDECAPLVAAGCSPVQSVCRQSNPLGGACEVEEASYRCPLASRASTTVGPCGGNVFCLGPNCFDTAHVDDPDFAKSMSMLEAAREAGVYLNTDTMRVFQGEDQRCRIRLFKNCCGSNGAGAGMSNQSVFGVGTRLVYDVLFKADNRAFIYEGMRHLLFSAGFNGSFTSYGVTIAVNGTALPAGSVTLASTNGMVVAFDPFTLVIAIVIYVVMQMMSCNSNEGQLSMREGAGLCHTVGTECSQCIRVFGRCVSCIEHTTAKCCFNSRLARLVNEQGRAQLGRGWGGAGSPACTGFSVAELQQLNFAAMDFSEVYSALVPAPTDLPTLQGEAASRLSSCYYGAGKC